MRKRTIYFLVLQFVLLWLRGGNDPVLKQAQADFKAVNAAYEQYQHYSMDTEYLVFSGHGVQSPMERKTGRFMRYQNQTYTRVDDIEVYAMDAMVISINTGDKQMAVGDAQTEDLLLPMGETVDSLLASCSRIEVKAVNANEKKYTLYFTQNQWQEYERIEVNVLMKEKRYARLVLYYATEVNLKGDFYAAADRPRLEVVYRNFKPLEQDPGVFKPSLYVTPDGKGKLKPVAKYYNYKVSDLRIETHIKRK